MYTKISHNPMFIITIVIILYFLFTSFFGFYTIIKPSKIISQVTPETLGLDYENISFTTTDNLVIRGWWIPSKKEGAPIDKVDRGSSISQGDIRTKTIILLHGYPADKGDILPAMSFLNKTYNLLLFDFRYLGQSDGNYSTLGAKETEDLSSAIGFLKSRGITEVGIWGFSVGGAVALMTAPNFPEIKVIVSESSYAQLDILSSQLYKVPILRHPLGFLTNLWVQIVLGINTTNISPAKIAQNLAIPILIIHSKDDNVIPFEHALLLQEAFKNNIKTEFWFREDLTHGQFSQFYQNRIGEFFEKNL